MSSHGGDMNETIAALVVWKEETAQNMNHLYLVIMGILVYFMQAGFAFLEAGSVRSKNTTNILIKNALDSLFAGVAYWLVGYAFAYGKGNSFIGYTYFAHSDMPDSLYAPWFFQYTFAAAASTIVSGAVAERCDFAAYMIYSTVITGIIYPVVTHWAWAEGGWLVTGGLYDIDGQSVQIGYADYAGSGVLHMLGGVAAFVGAWALGPRIGRFDKDTHQPVDIKGHSVPLAALGGFILVTGFFAFNASSLGSIATPGDGRIIARVVTNTVMAACGGAFTTMTMNKMKYFGDKKWSYLTTLNGCLTGMVAICGGCNQFHSYISFIVGILGGLGYMVTTWLVLFKCRVDDPLDATAVHFGGGIIGVIVVPIFSKDFGIVYFWDRASGLHLAWNLAGLVAIFCWTALLCSILFFSMKKTGFLRVSFEYEVKGLDIPKHGEPAYPADAYGHGWGEKGDSLFDLVTLAVKSTPKLTNQEIKVQIPPRPLGTPEMNAMRKNQKSSMESLASSASTNLTKV